MKVAINCRSFLTKQYTGIGRYAYHLVKSLSEIDSRNEYYLYAPKNLFDTKREVPRFNAPNFFVKVDVFNAGVEKAVGKIDIYHAPSPEDLNVKNAKIVVTVHDLVHKAFPEGHTRDTIRTAEAQLKDIVKKAERIICCSQNTINDLKRFSRVNPSKVRLVYQGVDQDDFYKLGEGERKLARRILKDKGLEEPFLLFVGTIEPRKNLKNLLKAYYLLRDKKTFTGKFVVVGMPGWMNEGLGTLIKELKIENDVKFLGFVTMQELRYCYNLAEVFVFPSFYEGFGFPIIEAMSCGAAVVTSNVSSCPEVAGDAALLIDPAQPEAIAEALERILENENLCLQLKERALKRAGQFSFERTARETLKVYEELAKSG